MTESAKQRRLTRYLVLVGLCGYLGIVWYLGWREVGTTLLEGNLAYIALAAFIIFAGNWARALKWRYVLGPGHDAFGIFFMSKISAEWSPGRVGEFSPMVLRKHRTPKMGAWIMLDRLLEISVTLLLGLIGLAVIRIVPWPAYAALAAASILGPIALLYILTRRPVYMALADRLREDSWPHRFAMLFAAMAEEFPTFTPRLPLAGFITAAAKCTDLAAVCLLFAAFGARISFALAATAKCALAIVSFIPLTPLGTGLPHLTQAGLMRQAAGVPGDVLAAAIGVEVVIVSTALWTSGGLAALLIRKRSFDPSPVT
jgi:uncharacterized protein (TIRG00374 family)